MCYKLKEPMNKSTYTAEQVAEAAGVPVTTLMRWARDRLVRPDQSDSGPGPRPIYVWREAHIREARIAARLVREIGLPMERAGEVLEEIRKAGMLESDELQPVFLQLLAPEDIGPVPPARPRLRVSTRAADPSQTALRLSRRAVKRGT